MSLSLTGARWTEAFALDAQVESLVDQGLDPITARCLAVRNPEAPAAWLSPTAQHLHDPDLMLGMGEALERLRQAVAEHQRVRIITDYDVDGTTSSLILQAALRLSGFEGLDYHIPDRFKEGYGFSAAAADAAADDGVDLIITADIGVRDHGAVAQARSRGVDVLICDHHLPAGADVPPDALVLCPPQAACDYPNPHLAACGVAFKLAQGLLADHPKRQAIERSLLKLAAIGTVCDMVPLHTLENRAIVTLGLTALNQDRHGAGLSALLGVAGLTTGQIDERDLGFRIGPRINAAGRVAHAHLVVRLLNSRDPVEARAYARQLDELNAHRKQLQKKLVDEVVAALPSEPDPFVLVHGNEADGWHRGVVGIVAARVKDEVHRPVAVVSIQGEFAVGSVRSVPAVHAVRALDHCSDLLVKYGGHPAAAGFTVPTKDLPALRERLCAYVSGAVEEDALVPVRTIDAEVSPNALSLDLHRHLRAIGPFGQGNPAPRLALRGVTAQRISVRANGRLLALQLRTAEGPVDAIWWGQAELQPTLEGRPIDLLGTLSTWTTRQGQERLQFEISDALVPEA
ncbi:MAG: single-stranded-DNA-specific exonuclease RecJ [Myxococcota bacterium]